MDTDKLDIDISQHVARALCVVLDRKPRLELDRVALRVAGGVGTWEATDGSVLLTISDTGRELLSDGVWLLDPPPVQRAGKMPRKWRTGQELRVTLHRMPVSADYDPNVWLDVPKLLAGYRDAASGPALQGLDARILALASAVSTAMGAVARFQSIWSIQHLADKSTGGTGHALDPIRMTMLDAPTHLTVHLLVMPCRLD